MKLAAFLLFLSFATETRAHGDLAVLLKTFESLQGPELQCGPPSVPQELDAESKLLSEKKWYEGAKDCSTEEAKTPAFEVLKVNEGFYVLRQNKCINFEAPFLYLYIGEEEAFLLDTGATSDPGVMPLRAWVDEVLRDHPKGQELKLTVAHSHAHGDHVAGDEQFLGRPNTRVIGTEVEDVAQAFGIKNWPQGEGKIDLGGRELSIIPIPGHEDSCIAVYDHRSGDLLTGDALYPGNVFLSRSSWPEFKDSINRLHEFSTRHPVRNILGAHIEMSAEPGKDFPYGSTHHPNEHTLPLRQEHLNELKNHLDQNPEPRYQKFNDFILAL